MSYLSVLSYYCHGERTNGCTFYNMFTFIVMNYCMYLVWKVLIFIWENSLKYEGPAYLYRCWYTFKNWKWNQIVFIYESTVLSSFYNVCQLLANIRIKYKGEFFFLIGKKESYYFYQFSLIESACKKCIMSLL